MTIRPEALTALKIAGKCIAALVICALVAAAQSSPSLTTLYSFTGGSDGGDPLAPLTGVGGVLYGTTHLGGAGGCPKGCGTVFSLTPPTSSGGAWTEATIHVFANSPNDGAAPYAGVATGSGVLYGASYQGGAWNQGTLYSLSPPAAAGGAWTETVLYSFAGAANRDGAYPEGGVVTGSNGVLYGATLFGGTGPCTNGCGTVYSLTPPASPGGAWTESVIYNFAGAPGDGANPSGVALGANGALYGNSSSGGASGAGTVFSLAPPASGTGAWTEAILYSFQNLGDGGNPQGGLVIGGSGMLYGTTFFGGNFSCAGGCGTVFSLTPPASSSGTWTEMVLHAFAGGSDGLYPTPGVAIASGVGGHPVIYGTTRAGGAGAACINGCGTVFSLTPQASGSAWAESVLFSFGGGRRGSNPAARVVIGAGGALYGTTGGGGTSGAGTVFRLTP